jgi:hypothetical protein
LITLIHGIPLPYWDIFHGGILKNTPKKNGAATSEIANVGAW